MKSMNLFILLVIALGQSMAQPATNPEFLGMSSQRLDRIDSMVNEEIDAQLYAGRSVLIARGGEIA